MVRRLFVLALMVAVLGLYIPSAIFAQEKIKIGIVRYSEESGYPDGQKGILEQLKKEGFDATKVDFDIRTAEGSKDKLIEILKEFRAKNPNLIIALGTTPVIEAYKEFKDIPIVATIVFDLVGAGVAKTWERSDTNVTGTCTWVDLSTMIRTLRQVSPVKRLGVLYNEKEVNAVLQLDELKKIEAKMDFTVIAANVATAEEAGDVTRSLVGQVDSIFITGATTVGKGLKDIVEVANKSKIPTVAHLADRSEKGILVAVSANPFKLGELAGKKAAQILRGARPTDIPIETLKSYDIAINLKTAAAMGIKIPVTLLRAATKVVE
jgi:putative ABC transport system substrate-binding protein